MATRQDSLLRDAFSEPERAAPQRCTLRPAPLVAAIDRRGEGMVGARRFAVGAVAAQPRGRHTQSSRSCHLGRGTRRKMVGARRFELPTPCTPCIPGPPARILRSGWEKNGLVRESENRPQVTSGRRESQGVTLDRGALRRFVVVDALTWQSYQVNEKREGARCHDVDTRSRARRGPGSTTAARGRVAFDRFEVRLEDNNEPRGREAMRDLGLPSLGEVCCSQQTHRTSNRSNRVRHTFRKPS